MFSVVFPLALVVLGSLQVSAAPLDGIFVWKNYPLPIGLCIPFLEKVDNAIISRSYKFFNCSDTKLLHYVYNTSDCSGAGIKKTFHDHDNSYTKLIHCHPIPEDKFGLVTVHIIQKLGDDDDCYTLEQNPAELVPERTLVLVAHMCVLNPEPKAVKHKWVECGKAGTLFEMYASACTGQPLDSYSIVTTDCSPVIDNDVKTGFSIEQCTRPINDDPFTIATTAVSAAPPPASRVALLAAVVLALFWL